MTIARIFFARLILACGLCPCAGSLAADFPPKEAVPIAVPLYLEQRQVGMVQMLIMPNAAESYVLAAPVLTLLKDRVPPESLKTLETTVTQGFLSLKDGTRGVVELLFDAARIALVVTIPSENKKLRSLRARRDFDAANKTITPPNAVSAYLNVFGAQDYVDRGLPSQHEGRQPLRMSVDGALNMKGWVLESSGDYIENDPRPWQRGDTRLVHDLPDDMIRTALGDLSYPVEGFQSFQPMLGLTVARNFDLQPYRVSEPTGRTSFFLVSSSRVDIYINDRKVQTLQLNSGPYDMTDFPVVNGSNNVKLVITDATGRVEVRYFDIVSDANLLAAGLHKFAYNVGVIATTANRDRDYDRDRPVLSAFHRYGVSDGFTLGGNLQADEMQRMAGIDATMGGNWGVLRVDLAGSYLDDAGDGFAWQTQYQIVDRGKIENDGTFRGTKNFTLLASYRSERFAPLGVLQPANVWSQQVTTRYSQQWSPTVSFGVGGGYKISRGDQRDDWNYILSLNKQLPDGIHINVNLQQRAIEGYGMFVSLGWTPRDSRQSLHGSHDSFSKTTRTDWNYAQEGRAQSMSASVGIVRAQDRYDSSGSVTYYGQRGEVTASHDIVTPYGDTDSASNATESRSELRFASALVYAGGHMALSRPVSNSFAIFAPDASIKDYPVGINPQGRRSEERTYEATTDGWGPVVLPNLTPYLYRTVRVDASGLPPGFDAGDSTYTFYPSYRSGTFVRLGSDANVLLDGTLLYKDEVPVALQAGSLSLIGEPDAPAETFFTNRAGRFRIEKLKPGHYVMQLYSIPGVTLSLTIPENAAGPTQAGILTLPVTAEEP
ncbi:MAG: fimbrial biogenesis outer membrane usher protein [Gammaproteobacteria bacterium]|nr:fimbrial biogenesis outer membrane usher protein [Gammaproteobacteria bacterium]